MTQPQEPTWDGDGTDPWLPTRLAHNRLIVTSERSVYDDWFAKISRWLVEVSRGVNTPYRLEPNAVWRYVPQWLREVADLVRDTIRPIVGRAYEQIFGSGYRYDLRPHVVQYLTEVQNRLAYTPAEVYDLIVAQIAEGSTAGESIPQLAARIELILNATATPRWQNRATTVARTETISAYNAGREGAFLQVAADLDEPFDHVWLATQDLRTRYYHRQADMQRVPLGQPFIVMGERLMRPGDPRGSARNVINCRCTTLLMHPNEEIDLSDRQLEDF